MVEMSYTSIEKWLYSTQNQTPPHGPYSRPSESNFCTVCKP
jgi:hypothetical protein